MTLIPADQLATEQIQGSPSGSSPIQATTQSPSKVLVVEPHPTLRTVLVQRLRQDGQLAAAVGSAEEAVDLCRDQSPDLLVSAELLEKSSALRLAQQLGCSVIVLTARTGVEPVVGLLDDGADDVLRKPFGLEELAARCRTLLKRGRIGLQERVDLRVDTLKEIKSLLSIISFFLPSMHHGTNSGYFSISRTKSINCFFLQSIDLLTDALGISLIYSIFLKFSKIFIGMIRRSC